MEGVNRTIKQNMYKQFRLQGSYKWNQGESCKEKDEIPIFFLYRTCLFLSFQQNSLDSNKIN